MVKRMFLIVTVVAVMTVTVVAGPASAQPHWAVNSWCFQPGWGWAYCGWVPYPAWIWIPGWGWYPDDWCWTPWRGWNPC